MDRDLDGFYLRVKLEDGSYGNKCFTDLTTEQQKNFLNTLSDEGLKIMCLEFAKIIKNIGDKFDLIGGTE